MSIAHAVRTPTSGMSTADARLLTRYRQTRAPHLRDELVHRYLPLARFSANRYARGSEPFDDLLQVACIGLLKAIDRFDPERGIAFSSYAMPTMAGELRRHFRDRAWNVRPPRDLQDDALAVERAETELVHDFGRSPTIEELGDYTGMDIEAVLEAREALSARSAVSFSAPVAGGDHPDDHALSDRLGVVDDGFETAELRAVLDGLCRHLGHRDREILRLRFQEDLTQAEIGERLGLSQMHVSRLLRDALERLRAVSRDA